METHMLDDPTGPANLYILVSDKNNWLFCVMIISLLQGSSYVMNVHVFITT